MVWASASKIAARGGGRIRSRFYIDSKVGVEKDVARLVSLPKLRGHRLGFVRFRNGCAHIEHHHTQGEAVKCIVKEELRVATRIGA